MAVTRLINLVSINIFVLFSLDVNPIITGVFSNTCKHSSRVDVLASV